MRCLATKNKKSDDQCRSRPIVGLRFCGKHVRAKVPRLWVDVHAKKALPIIRFQAIVRGHQIRRHISLAGPGVLDRRNVTNDEDVVTCIEKDKVSPLDYFAFEENGKIWWFEFSTIWKWCLRSFHPANPYTKTLLTSDTRKRLRTLWGLRFRKRMLPPEESQMFIERLTGRWNIISQTFVDNGFEDVHPNMFIGLDKEAYRNFFRLLFNDLDRKLSETQSATLCRLYMKNCQGETDVRAILHASMYILRMITMVPDPYPLVFKIMSALYRC